MRLIRRSLALGFALGLLLGVCANALANGTVRVQQSDGSVQKYPQTRMAWTGHALWLHSADGKGVLEITTGACTYVNDLLRCYPNGMILHQNGKQRPIAVSRGTIYMNFTDQQQRLPLSSQAIAPQALMVAIQTQHGTYVTVRGHLDGARHK